jgi:hypothetical protein
MNLLIRAALRLGSGLEGQAEPAGQRQPERVDCLTWVFTPASCQLPGLTQTRQRSLLFHDRSGKIGAILRSRPPHSLER